MIFTQDFLTRLVILTFSLEKYESNEKPRHSKINFITLIAVARSSKHIIKIIPTPESDLYKSAADPLNLDSEMAMNSVINLRIIYSSISSHT